MVGLPSVPGVKHYSIKFTKTKLHVAEAGKGKPLLLLHGWPQHWYIWRKVIPELSQTYRLIMPDLPGFGWSDMPRDKDFRKEKLADDLLQLIEILEYKQIGLIGHDWGGWIGFLMCQKKPQRFSNYLALGIGFPFSTNMISPLHYWRFLYQLPIATPFAGKMLLQMLPQITEWGMKQCAYKKNSWTQKDLHLFSSVLQNADKAQASSLLYRTFLLEDLKKVNQYKNQPYTVPTTLLLGEYDPIINPSLFKNFKQTETLQIETVKKCGHFIPEEQPEVVIKYVKKLFIQPGR